MPLPLLAVAALLCGGAAAPPSLDALLTEYKALGLPLPPAGATLVRFWTGGHLVAEDGTERSRVPDQLGFLLKARFGAESPVVLRGTDEVEPPCYANAREVAPDPDKLRDVEVGGDTALAMAIQCHARGWDKLARHLLRESIRDDARPPVARLVQAAWDYWRGYLFKPDTDRKPVSRRLRDLMGRDAELDTEGHRLLLRDLAVALVPGTGKPGTVESLIDDLVDCHAAGYGGDSPDERYERVARLGFDAVPALIAHLGDERLTRARSDWVNNFFPWTLRVQHVASNLLERLAGQYLGRDQVRRQQAYPVTKAAAEAWWAEARKPGEEAYLLRHVVSAEKSGDQPAGVRDHLLELILAKYPHRIPELYRTVLSKHPESDTRSPAAAVSRCPLSSREKLDILLPAIRHKSKDHRLAALSAIAAVDRARFSALWLAAAEDRTESPEDLAELAVEIDDPRVWPRLEAMARQAKPAVRMPILQAVCRGRETRHRRERVRLLLAFLDDPAVWNAKTDARHEADWPGAGFPYPTIEMRDHAALCLAWLLGTEVDPDVPDRTPADWAKVRDQVRAAARQNLGPGN